jgi:hypothetical protein
VRNDNHADPERAGRASPDPPDSQTPFERFEAFARKILSVPKTEIEARERTYRESRKARKHP